MAGQLADQYAKQKAAGFSYPNEEELPKFFRGQAAKLAANGVTSIYDVGTQERETEKIIDYYEDGSPIYGPSTEQFLINKQTGQDIRDVVLKPTWEKDPEAYRFRKPVTLETTRAGFTRWGKDLSVEGQGDYGLNFVDGVPVYTPFWKDTATDPGAIIIAGALLGAGLYQLAGAGAAAGAGTAAEPDDPESLCRAVLALTGNQAQRECLGRNGRRFALVNCSRQIVAGRYLSLLDDVVNDREGRSSGRRFSRRRELARLEV